MCTFRRPTCSHLTLLNFITMITFGGVLHFVIFCILLTIFVSDVFGIFSPRHPISQSTDTPGPLGYRPQGRQPVSFVGRSKELFCSPNCPDLLWGPHSLLFNGHRGHLLENTVAVDCESGFTPTLPRGVVFSMMLFVLSANTLQSLFLPYGRTQSFTLVHNNIYIYDFMYFNFWVFRQETNHSGLNSNKRCSWSTFITSCTSNEKQNLVHVFFLISVL
jgi:hypothetical protein